MFFVPRQRGRVCGAISRLLRGPLCRSVSKWLWRSRVRVSAVAVDALLYVSLPFNMLRAPS